MKQVLLLLTLLTACGFAHAKTTCTTEPKAKWMKEADFKKKVEGLGYKIEKFETDKTCYEIEGRNKDGQKVDIKFNPVDASVVKEELED